MRENWDIRSKKISQRQQSMKWSLLFIGLLAGCSEAPTITVSGPIKDLGNGEALVGCRVCLSDSDLCTETDSTGQFSLSGVEAESTHSLKVDLDGYLPGLVPFASSSVNTELAVISLGGDIIMELRVRAAPRRRAACASSPHQKASPRAL